MRKLVPSDGKERGVANRILQPWHRLAEDVGELQQGVLWFVPSELTARAAGAVPLVGCMGVRDFFLTQVQYDTMALPDGRVPGRSMCVCVCELC